MSTRHGTGNSSRLKTILTLARKNNTRTRICTCMHPCALVHTRTHFSSFFHTTTHSKPHSNTYTHKHTLTRLPFHITRAAVANINDEMTMPHDVSLRLKDTLHRDAQSHSGSVICLSNDIIGICHCDVSSSRTRLLGHRQERLEKLSVWHAWKPIQSNLN